MTDRLYYNDSFLCVFRACVLDTRELKRDGTQSTWAVRLDRTAFYPTSGGQPFDVGTINTQSKSGVLLEAAVEEVFEDDQGEVWHRLTKVLPPGAGPVTAPLPPGALPMLPPLPPGPPDEMY